MTILDIFSFAIKWSKMIKNIKHFIHNFKLLNSFFIFICSLMIQSNTHANEFFTIENISIDIISEDIISARNNATNQAIFIGLEKLLSWKLDDKDYLIIISILDSINEKPNIKEFVAGYKIHYEKLSDIKYQAEFSIFFNLKNIKNWLDLHNISFQENLNSKIINLNANFNSFRNWRLLVNNITSIKEILDYKVLSLSHNSSLIQVSINIENESSLFNIFNKSRIDIQKRLNANNEYNISLIDYNKTTIESFDSNDKNYKNNSTILLTE